MLKKTILISLIALAVSLVGLAGTFAQGTATSPTAGSNSDANSLPVDAVSFNFFVPDTNLQPGVKHENVKHLQEILKAQKYLAPDVVSTEHFGPKTKEALIKFQKDHNLPAYGFFGPATRKAIKDIANSRPAVVSFKEDKYKHVDIACMKHAVEKRENALLAAYDVYSGKIKSAKETRKAELLAAWDIQDPEKRYPAINQAWEKFRNAVKSAREEWINSRNSAWKQFTQDTVNCKAPDTEIQQLQNQVEN